MERSDFDSLSTKAPADPAGVLSFLVPPSPANIEALAKRLREGALVAVPTETVYGLAADAFQESACEAIFRLKGRPLIDPLIVHVQDLAAAEAIACFNPPARHLAETFWPGALTLVLPRRPTIPDIVSAGRPTVAVRCPAHPVFRALCREADRPLAAPSANPFGYISPTRAEHVVSSFPSAGLPVLDGGRCEIGLESTIVDLTVPEAPRILRSGHITAEQLSTALGRHVEAIGIRPTDSPSGEMGLTAPGMLTRHYSPRTPTRLRDAAKMRDPGPAIARLFFRRPARVERRGDFWLTEDGSAEVAGRGLYDLLRTLDADASWTELWIERPPALPSTRALLDRLQRASTQ